MAQPPSALPAVRSRRAPLGELLIEMGKLAQADLARALELKRERGLKLGQALLALDLVREDDLAEALRRQGKFHCIHLTPGLVDPEVAVRLGAERSLRLGAIALNRIAGVTTVALEDPSDVYGVDEIALILGTPVLAVHAQPSRIRACIEAVLGAAARAQDRDALESIVDSAQTSDLGVSLASSSPSDREEEGEDLDQPVIHLLRSVLKEAFEAHASDIHLEPGEERFVVRFRVDGSLFERVSLPRGWARPCVTRLKVLASMDIAQRRLPQDGRAQAEINGCRVDMRIATTPTLYGEGAVIRILDGGRELRDLEALDLEPPQLASLERMIECSDGFVLATGPTGSGKTTTLYALLKKLNRPDTKIITLEDPVENQVDGLTQISTNAKIGLSFAAGLRSILRQDPDIVLLGEIRDRETAEIAVQAALTGHLVLATLHTVGAAETVTRLQEMGIEPYLVADTLRGIVSQRLVRRICPDCREPATPSQETLHRLGIEAGGAVFYQGRGCDACHGLGFRGRLGLYEIMGMTEEVAQVVREGKKSREILAAALAQGLVTLRADGVRKARAGQTTLREVLSVTSRG